MKKSFNTKLSLKKTDIATLSEKEMKGLEGGGYTTPTLGCPAPTTVCVSNGMTICGGQPTRLSKVAC